MNKKKTNTLITGGAGFIGSHVANECLKLGHNVVVIDDLSGGFRDQVPSGAVFTKGSIQNHKLLARLFEEYNFDYVYHLAAYAAEGLSHFIRKFNYKNNLIGSINLINLAILHDVKCFVFTSSIAVYGSGDLPLKEHSEIHPEDPYGIAKYAVELDLQAAHKLFGLNYIIFRPHNVYGENQNIGDKYRNVIGIFMNQLMAEKPITIFGDGLQSRAFSYIDDVAPYIASSVHNSAALNQIINLGSDDPYTIKHLANIIAAEFNKDPIIRHLEPRNEVIHAYCDHSKAKRIFNITQTTPLEHGIKRMAAWAIKVGCRNSKNFKQIEVNKLLPEGWSTQSN